jgi:hypothetical protein
MYLLTLIYWVAAVTIATADYSSMNVSYDTIKFLHFCQWVFFGTGALVLLRAMLIPMWSNQKMIEKYKKELDN